MRLTTGPPGANKAKPGGISLARQGVLFRAERREFYGAKPP